MSGTIECLTWSDVREQVSKVNRDLFELLDGVLQAGDVGFYRITYSYGEKIISRCHLCLDTENQSSLPSSIRQMPLGLVLTRSLEQYIETVNAVLPYHVYGAGDCFGIYENLTNNDPKYACGEVSAGLRTVFLLPRISDRSAHLSLQREFSIDFPPPKSLLEHHRVFTSLACYSDWNCQVLVFDKTIFTKHKQAFFNYWIKQTTDKQLNEYNSMAEDKDWQVLSERVRQQRWHIKPQLFNYIRYILRISNNSLPGYIPAGIDEDGLPVHFIQDCYINKYGLKNHTPIIMQPANLSSYTGMVYISLAMPTLITYPVARGEERSLMADMRDLKLWLQRFHETSCHQLATYKFFHSDEDQTGQIQLAKTMPLQDRRLLKTYDEYRGRSFPDNSPFLKGCVRIDSAL